MKSLCLAVFSLVNILNCSVTYSQKDSSSCKVTWEALAGSYSGECKNGLANGKGEARGFEYYKGAFKEGMPNGTGLYYYNDSLYHDGNFQDGLKEGKGEMHYLRKGKPDSIIKGYWSGDEFRGNKYTTYNFKTTETFDNIDIIPSKASGKTVTIEISTTSGLPGGNAATTSVVLTLINMVSPTGSILKTQSRFESSFKSSVTFELIGFPCKLFGTLSDNQTFELELYKAADWKVRFYKNR